MAGMISEKRKANLAVLASGSGSNLASLISAVNQGIIDNARIALVISNKQSAYALQRAREAGIPAINLKRSEFANDEAFDAEVVNWLRKYDIDVVLLAGYLRILTEPLLESYSNRILNIHPSLLPDFGGVGMYGIKVHEAVINTGVAKSGCTIHIVNKTVDGGPILSKAEVPVFPDDTPHALAERVLKEEHKLYPATVREFVNQLLISQPLS
jgi:phosphoribosylglycinamide formyltransferase-1